jgi:ABC-type lipoprotein export system ATPase subunit
MTDDRISANKVLELKKEVNREGKATFLICTHDGNISARRARRILVKDGGAERVQG